MPKKFIPPSRKFIPPLEALRAFDTAVRLKGIRTAALRLGRSHTVVSRHIQNLEAWTGVKLIERTPNGVILTDDGKHYHKEVASAIDALANATIDVMRRGQYHRLSIWCVPGFALHWMSRRIGLFERKNPNIDIELRPIDRNTALALYETDVDIRFVAKYGPRLEMRQNLRSEIIATIPIIAVASPDYIERMGPINTPDDLLNHRLLHEINFDNWAYWLSAHNVYDEIKLDGPRLWHGHLTLDAALHGRGIALINYLVAADHIADGNLIEIGQGRNDFQPYTNGEYYFITQADRWNSPLVKKYRQWLVHTLREELPQFMSGAPT